jgi:nitrogenase molybdenum-cofactor synthesis protein NifE
MGVRGAVTVVVGIAECAFYCHDIAAGHGGRSSGELFNVVLSWHDVTFGCLETLGKAFAELIDERRPEAVFIITTCVPEITGDDIDAAAAGFEAQYRIPVVVVHTEHFKTTIGGESVGTQNALAACAGMMERTAPDGSINLLGQGLDDFRSHEIWPFLQEAGVTFRRSIPGTPVSGMAEAANARLNVVPGTSGLFLAEEMERRFGIPYVALLPRISPDDVLHTYEELFGQLGIGLPERVRAMAAQAKEKLAALDGKLTGKSFFLGQVEFPIFSVTAMLVRLGMTPQLVQLLRGSPAEEPDAVNEILEKSDPLILQQYGDQGIDELREKLRPDMVIGIGVRRQRGEGSPGGFTAIGKFLDSLTAPPATPFGGRGEGGRGAYGGRDRGGREGRGGDRDRGGRGRGESRGPEGLSPQGLGSESLGSEGRSVGVGSWPEDGGGHDRGAAGQRERGGLGRGPNREEIGRGPEGPGSEGPGSEGPGRDRSGTGAGRRDGYRQQEEGDGGQGRHGDAMAAQHGGHERHRGGGAR